MNVLNLFRLRRTTCRHPLVCDQTPDPNSLMCPAHAADESFAFNRHDRLAPWDLNRRSVWPTNRERRNG